MPRCPYAVPLVRSYSEFHAQKVAKDKKKDLDALQKKLDNCIVLTDEEDKGDGKDDGNAEMMSDQTISSAESALLIKVKKRWTKEENAIIVDHMGKMCDRVYLQTMLGRPRTSVVDQVQRILRFGLEAANKTATK